jgi:predicted transcriptional regulator
MQENSDVISVRVPAKLHKKIAAIAKGIDRSQNWLINQAIENYLEVYEWQKEEIKKAIAEADAGGKFYSSDEMDKMLERFKQ